MSMQAFRPRAEHSARDIATNVRNLIKQCLNIDAEVLLDHMHLADDCGADWLDRLELMSIIETEFAIELGDEAIDELQRVGELVRLVEAHSGGQRAGSGVRA